MPNPPAPVAVPMEIFTDGGCIPNPGRGGWGFVAVQDGRSTKEGFGGEPGTTNNCMEIMAIIQGLISIPPGAAATIVSDSQHAINVISGTWRAKANRALVKEAQALMGERHITFRWVRGHDGDRWNERADALATQGMAKGTSKRGKSPASPVERAPRQCRREKTQKRNLRVDLSKGYLDGLVGDGWIRAEELEDPDILGAAIEDRDDCQKRGTFRPGPISTGTTA